VCKNVCKNADTVVVEYRGKDSDTVVATETSDFESVQMYLTSGETEALAKEALVEGICQQCLAADHPERLV